MTTQTTNLETGHKGQTRRGETQEGFEMTDFAVNQIVRGHVCGVFVVLAFVVASDNGTRMAVLKAVNPNNLGEHSPGELRLPVDALRPY